MNMQASAELRTLKIWRTLGRGEHSHNKFTIQASVSWPRGCNKKRMTHPWRIINLRRSCHRHGDVIGVQSQQMCTTQVAAPRSRLNQKDRMASALRGVSAGCQYNISLDVRAPPRGFDRLVRFRMHQTMATEVLRTSIHLVAKSWRHV